MRRFFFYKGLLVRCMWEEEEEEKRGRTRKQGVLALVCAAWSSQDRGGDRADVLLPSPSVVFLFLVFIRL